MEKLLACKTVMELVFVLSQAVPTATIKNFSASGRIEIDSDTLQAVVYYDDNSIVYFKHSISIVA